MRNDYKNIEEVGARQNQLRFLSRSRELTEEQHRGEKVVDGKRGFVSGHEGGDLLHRRPGVRSHQRERGNA